MNRVYNFSAGPSMLPMPVLERAAAEMVSYGESGMSVMEILKSFGICVLCSLPIWAYCAFFMVLAN